MRRLAYSLAAALVCGFAWFFSGTHPLLAALSLAALLFLPPMQSRWWQRAAVALAYLLPATWSIVPSYAVFFHPASGLPGIGVWIAVAFLLAGPWAIARGTWSTLAAALLSGALGPLSIWPLAGVLFPGLGIAGLALFIGGVLLAGEFGAHLARGRPAHGVADFAPMLIAFSLIANLAARPAPAPAGWHGVDTVGLKQTGNDVFAGLRNTQKVISAGQAQPTARVLVFPEAALNDMLPGTQAMVSAAVPKGQVWLIGAEDGTHDGVWRFEHGKAPFMVSDSVLPMPLSMWRPWAKDSYRPAWSKTPFKQSGLRVWSAICYEQVTPFAWLEAVFARPDVLLLQSNAWWAQQGNPAPAIQAAQAMAWARLLGTHSLLVLNNP